MEFKPFRIRDEIHVESIVTVHYFQFARGYVFSGESHDFWELVYMDRGSAEIGADDRRYLLTEGEIVFHKPGEFHTIWAGGSKAPDIVVISFVCASPAMARFEGARMPVSDSGKRLIADVITEAGNAWENKPGSDYQELISRRGSPVGSAQMVKISLEALLLRLLRAMDASDKPVTTAARANLMPKTPEGRKVYLDKLALEIENYMASHLDDRITIDSLCRRFSISGTSLKLLFRRRQGRGVNEYLSELRHDSAKRLIREGLLNMSAVAEACGYNSLHYFSRKFTRMEGMTPTEYARSVKGMADF